MGFKMLLKKMAGAAAAVLIVMTVAGIETLLAQTERKSERLMVTIVNVKPEMVDEYENFVKNETNPALQKAGIKWRDAWKTAMFGNSFEYVYVEAIDNYAMFDGPGPIERALGKEGNAAWSAKSRSMINSVKRMQINTRPDLSYDGEGPRTPGVAVVTHATVAQGRNADLEAWVKADLLPVMRQAKVPAYLVSQMGLGGNANEYITLVMHANMAELEKGPPVYRVMSKEAGDKLYAKLPAGVIVNVERYVVRYSPELSFGAGGSVAK
jgi:hypothetical protein